MDATPNHQTDSHPTTARADDAANVTDVTVYATNIISLIGIGVSIDYSLFLVNRFREELGRGHDVRTATAMSCATAGKAVFYSGITVAIGLMGMLFFTNTSLPSLGIGGTIAVTIAMVYSTIVLPAVMAWLGPRVNSLKIPYALDMSAKDATIDRAELTALLYPNSRAVLLRPPAAVQAWGGVELHAHLRRPSWDAYRLHAASCTLQPARSFFSNSWCIHASPNSWCYIRQRGGGQLCDQRHDQPAAMVLRMVSMTLDGVSVSVRPSPSSRAA